MGANTFMVAVCGENAKDAFNEACDSARYEYGHGGYTGTIAEKTNYVSISLPHGMDAESYARKLIDNDDSRIFDKWGPAGCILMNDGQYLFFGWASS